MLTKNPTFGQRNGLLRSAPDPKPQEALASAATARAEGPDLDPSTPAHSVVDVQPEFVVEEPKPVAQTAGPAMAMTTATGNGGADARWARRTPARLGGQILHSSLATAILCTVRDTSSTGARLEVVSQRGGNISRDRVPDQFTLFMPADRLEVDCQVMWRQGLMVGVRYVSPARRTAKQQPLKKPEPPKKPHTSLVKLLINPM